ncbi:MAG TPA: glycosyltransferase family 39 protein [Anaerolineae bacterium]|nr:glycosyltransferase family 39 protein [Anaerolineae bacterium]
MLLPMQRRSRPDVLLGTASGIRESVAFGLAIASILSVFAYTLIRGLPDIDDQYSRVLLAASWAESPTLMGGSSFWLPGQTYLLGLALKVHYDLVLTPRIITTVFSLIALGTLYLLARRLFNRWVALLSLLVVGLQDVYIMLSLNPLSDAIYLAFVVGFLYFFFRWLDSDADRWLLLAALLLGLSTSLRYEGWFILVAFGLYLGLRWLVHLWTTHSLRAMRLLALGVSCLPAGMWILGSSINRGDPSLEDAVGRIGPLTDLFPSLAYLELLLQDGALIGLLAVVGIVLSRRLLAHKAWLYLTFSLVPLVMLTLTNGGRIGTAYPHRYVSPYLILLTPFCAYALWRLITAYRQSADDRLGARWGLLAMMSAFNLWVVYLRFTQEHSVVLIALMALASVVLSYRLLARKYWLYWTLSLAPLPIFIVSSKSGFLAGSESSYLGAYLILLALGYAYGVWQARETLKPPSAEQWQLAGLGLLAIVGVYTGWGALLRLPSARSTRDLEAGLFVRRLFDEGALAADDKVLLEIVKAERKNYKTIQVMSNHPANFILDRIPFRILAPVYREPDAESFLLNPNSSPYEIDKSLVKDAIAPWYETQVNPFSLNPPISLDQYLADEHIRLAIIKAPRLKALFNQQTDFERIAQIEDYLFYYTVRSN